MEARPRRSRYTDACTLARTHTCTHARIAVGAAGRCGARSDEGSTRLARADRHVRHKQFLTCIDVCNGMCKAMSGARSDDGSVQLTYRGHCHVALIHACTHECTHTLSVQVRMEGQKRRHRRQDGARAGARAYMRACVHACMFVHVCVHVRITNKR